MSPSGEAAASGRGVTAVLGPTNTGKTHLAIERMLGHETGMIGLPLRLLAREVYDRVAATRGPSEVALITGEEKIVPGSPRYYVSTVEAMPLDIPVDFLAIDEIQLCADADRGHIFTQRLLQARGQTETMLLGAATMQRVIQDLLPGANFINRPRFSQLSFAGSKKLTRLPRRSAIVAFSADRVYAIAELIRRQRGGAAVVLGALSPRTRNAQVALYEAGDVDFLVATDAIGMGLNMDVDHVAFSGRRKFDGHVHRQLSAPEMAQIAGRAGRHMNDGTFGPTGDCEEFDSDLVDRIEHHRFDPIKTLIWRSTDLDFASVPALMASLSVQPGRACLMRTRRGDDFAVLEYLSNSDGASELAKGTAAVATLWDVCQIPDYRKIGLGDHATLVTRVFEHLMSDAGKVPEDWMAKQVAYADRVDGDIDALANRIAHVRTWTFIANHPHWLADASHWQERTREIEDRLSDALHERLTQRFVDRRTSVLMKRLREKDSLLAGVTDDGDVVVEGEYVGKLEGLRFSLDGSATSGADAKALQAAAVSVLSSELSARARRIAGEDDSVFSATDSGYVTWRGAVIARLEPGDAILTPQFKLLVDEQMQAPDQDRIRDRISAWLDSHLRAVLAPLFAIEDDEAVTGLARGVGFRLLEHLGLMPREPVAADIQQLDQNARGLLRRHGVRFGAYSIYIPAFLKPLPASLRLLLFRLWQEKTADRRRDDWPEPPQAGLTSLHVGRDAPAGFFGAAGYRLCGSRAVRADMLERLADTIRPLVNWKPSTDGDSRPDGAHPSGGFTVTPTMMSLVGCSGDDFAEILNALGFRHQMMPLPKVIASAAPEAAAETGAAPDAADGSGVAPTDDTASDVQAEAGAEGGAPSNTAEPETVAADADPEPGETVQPETAAPTADTDSAAGEPQSADGEASEQTSGATTGPDEAPTEIAVWRPKPRRPVQRRQGRGRSADQDAGSRNAGARRGQKRDGARPNDARPAEGKRGRGKGKRGRDGARPAQAGGPGGGKPERRPAPEDSPFAALQALKDKMDQESDQPPS